MKVLSCLVHQLTEKQQAELAEEWGTTTLLAEAQPELAAALKQCQADPAWLLEKAEELLQACQGFEAVILPIGSPAFMFGFAQLTQSAGAGQLWLFAHSERKSIEVAQPDGSVQKKAVFEHQNFVEVALQ